MSDRKDVYEIITNRVLDALAKGTVPWHRPWALRSNGDPQFPVSMSTNKPYRGMNLFLLGMSGYDSPWWGTYNKIAELSGMVKDAKGRWVSPDDTTRGVRPGERGTMVILWTNVSVKIKDAKPGEPDHKRVPILRYYNVFNADQADALPARYHETTTPVETAGTFAEHQEADQIVSAYLARKDSPRVVHGGNQAFWTIAHDVIHLPEPETFDSAAEYHCTRFHEMAHSTGHPRRLNREECIKYTEEHGRPREEMCAEMTAAMLMAIAGIEDETAFNNSASYIESWRRHLGDDPHLIITAAARAQHAADYILDIHFACETEAA